MTLFTIFQMCVFKKMDVLTGRLYQISKLKSSTALCFLPVRSERCTPTPPRRAAATDPASLKKKTRNVADVNRHVGAVLPSATAGAIILAGHVTLPLVRGLLTGKTVGTHAHNWPWSPSMALVLKAAITKKLILKLPTAKTVLKKPWPIWMQLPAWVCPDPPAGDVLHKSLKTWVNVQKLEAIPLKSYSVFKKASPRDAKTVCVHCFVIGLLTVTFAKLVCLNLKLPNTSSTMTTAPKAGLGRLKPPSATKHSQRRCPGQMQLPTASLEMEAWPSPSTILLCTPWLNPSTFNLMLWVPSGLELGMQKMVTAGKTDPQ